jgi:hypothetical protein
MINDSTEVFEENHVPLPLYVAYLYELQWD